jgi:hypothetical protein
VKAWDVPSLTHSLWLEITKRKVCGRFQRKPISGNVLPQFRRRPTTRPATRGNTRRRASRDHQGPACRRRAWLPERHSALCPRAVQRGDPGHSGVHHWHGPEKEPEYQAARSKARKGGAQARPQPLGWLPR